MLRTRATEDADMRRSGGGWRQHELGDDEIRGELGLAVPDALDPDLDHDRGAADVQRLGVGDDLVALQAGAEDVQLQLDRREVVARRDAAEGRPGGDGVAERGPGAAVDEAARMQVRRSTTTRPRACVSSISSGSIPRSPGKLPRRNCLACSVVTCERSALARSISSPRSRRGRGRRRARRARAPPRGSQTRRRGGRRRGPPRCGGRCRRRKCRGSGSAAAPALRPSG